MYCDCIYHHRPLFKSISGRTPLPCSSSAYDIWLSAFVNCIELILIAEVGKVLFLNVREEITFNWQN